LKDTLKKAEAEYDTLENALQNKYLNDEKVHIEHLLEHLKVGGACPVCQQTVKEIPESISYLTQDEEQKIEALREHQERIKTALETNDRELYAERKTIEDKERIDLKYAKEKLEQLTQTIKKTTEDFYSKKSALQQLDETKEKLHVLEKGLHDGELKLQNYQTRLNEVTNLQQDFTDVTQFQEHSAFKEAFYDRKDKVDHYFEEFDAVKSNIEKSASERVKIEERLKLIAERLEELAQNFTHYEEMVTSFLEEYQFSSREDLWTLPYNWRIVQRLRGRFKRIMKNIDYITASWRH
jgi:exonuclease SbcC